MYVKLIFRSGLHLLVQFNVSERADLWRPHETETEGQEKYDYKKKLHEGRTPFLIKRKFLLCNLSTLPFDYFNI